jgi:hypothetical protein
LSPHLISTTQFPEIQPGSYYTGSISETFLDALIKILY